MPMPLHGEGLKLLPYLIRRARFVVRAMENVKKNDGVFSTKSTVLCAPPASQTSSPRLQKCRTISVPISSCLALPKGCDGRDALAIHGEALLPWFRRHKIVPFIQYLMPG